MYSGLFDIIHAEFSGLLFDAARHPLPVIDVQRGRDIGHGRPVLRGCDLSQKRGCDDDGAGLRRHPRRRPLL